MIRVVSTTIFAFLFILWLLQDSQPRKKLDKLIIHYDFVHGHPIEVVINEKRRYLESKLDSQSRNVDEAVTEYKRRYGRRPPAGFDEWFLLAQQHDFVLVDEFDTFMASLEPFHGLPLTVLHQRLSAVQSSDAIGRMCTVNIANGRATISQIMGDVGRRLTNQNWTSIVPYNFTMYLNAWDEPMLNVPADEIGLAVNNAKVPGYSQLEDTNQTFIIPFVESGKQSGWAATRQGCAASSPARQFSCSKSANTSFDFIANHTERMDVCLQCGIKDEHGLLTLPINMHLEHLALPIWSASKASHFNDILYPSSYYIGVRGDYKPEKDRPWDEKDNQIYWTGSSTGGFATSQLWRKMQRQRLVLETNANPEKQIELLRSKSGDPDTYVHYRARMATVQHLFKTAITNVVQCEEAACKEQREAFQLDTGAKVHPQDEAYKHKFLLDLDGNGFSGRFYRLLRSKSVVVKSTILQEYHDDRLVEWVHYVPLSTSYDELPELARFLASTAKGLELSERIARESTEWHDKALRDVDLQLIFLRMMLEYGRLLQPDVTL